MNFLPLEILFEIFKFLEPNKNIPLVCKRFNLAYKKDILWSIYLFRDYKIQDKTPKEKYIEYYRFSKLQKWLEKYDQKYTFEEMKNMERLYLNDNKLENLPKEIGNLKNLKTLNLYNNKLENLPKEIGKLKNLEELYLSDNKLEKLPKEIGNLTNLKILHLDSNKLKSLPKEFENLKNLEEAYLEDNDELDFFSKNIHIRNLTVLKFR